MRNHPSLFTLLALAACHPSPAPIAVPKPPSPPPEVLRGVTLIDGTGGEPQPNTSIVLQGDRIRFIGPDADYTPPSAAHVVALQGKFVIPGLISAHSHVGFVDGTEAKAENSTRENIQRQLVQYEAYGVLTITSLGFNGDAFYALQPDIHAGRAPGADLFGADRGIGVTDGAPPVAAGADNLYRVQTPEGARNAVIETATRHPDLVKIWVDDFHGSLPEKMDPKVQQAIIDEAHKHKLRVAAHVFYLDDAKALVADGVDILAHGVRDRLVDDDFITALRQHGTWYVPTLGLDETFYLFAQHPELLRDPFLRHALQPPLVKQLEDPAWRASVLEDQPKLRVDEQAVRINAENVKRLYDAGVKLGFGTDSGATPLRVPGFAEHHELQLLAAAGVPPLQALHMATAGSAALLGLGDRGVLAAGKLADFLVLNADPSKDIAATQKIFQVWHRGRRVRDGIDAFTP
jgi:imidazolonepropionase-like amidohydrolase